MNTIFHITQSQQWEEAKNLGSYRGDTLDTEGFIHCSQVTQIFGVAHRYFLNQKNLVILVIDADKVQAEIRYELAKIGEEFPHIYGTLNLDAVLQVVDFELGENGKFILPDEILNFS